MQSELFLCQCNSPEHQLIFSYFPDEQNVYVTVHLTPIHGFWKRLKSAVWYLFGHRSIYGHFDEFILKPQDTERLQSVVNFLKNSK